MNRIIAKQLLNISVLILLIGVLFIVFNLDNVKSDSDLGILKSKKDFHLVLNGKRLDFSIRTYLQRDVSSNYLVQNNFFLIRRTRLLGFEGDIVLCNKPVVRLEETEAICLVEDVGAHSQAISFVNSTMSQVKIIEGKNTIYYVISDSPNYQIRDYNGDKIDDLIIDNRDYDKNPLTSIIRSYYSGSKDNLIFDKAENLEVK